MIVGRYAGRLIISHRRCCLIRRMDTASRWTCGRSESYCEIDRAINRWWRDSCVDRYTLLIGKPPFQTKDVKAIYKRIRENRYEFPQDRPISQSAQDLIMSILNPNPGEVPLRRISRPGLMICGLMNRFRKAASA